MPRLRNTRRPNWRWLLAIVSVVSLTLLLAAACGGDEDSDDNAGAPTATTTVTPTPTDGDDTPTPAVTGDGETSSESVSKELQSLASEWGDTSAKVSYDISVSGGDDAFTGSMTLYWRDSDWRMDVSTGEGDVTMILADGTSYICSAMLGEPQCFSFETLESDLAASVPFQDLVDPDAINDSIDEVIDGLDIDQSEQTIAGEKAECFSASGTVDGETGAFEWCFASDGILLRMAGSSDDPDFGEDVTLEATSISRDVSDADFEPPYPVTEFPDLGDLDLGDFDLGDLDLGDFGEE